MKREPSATRRLSNIYNNEVLVPKFLGSAMDPQQTNNIYIGDNKYTKDDVSDNKFTNYGN